MGKWYFSALLTMEIHSARKENDNIHIGRIAKQNATIKYTHNTKARLEESHLLETRWVDSLLRLVHSPPLFTTKCIISPIDWLIGFSKQIFSPFNTDPVATSFPSLIPLATTTKSPFDTIRRREGEQLSALCSYKMYFQTLALYNLYFGSAFGSNSEVYFDTISIGIVGRGTLFSALSNPYGARRFRQRKHRQCPQVVPRWPPQDANLCHHSEVNYLTPFQTGKHTNLQPSVNSSFIDT